jgi:hypothetical protein
MSQIINKNKREIIFNEFEPLMNKIIYYDGKLLKIQKYNTIYLYAYLYEIQYEESFNNDVVFYYIGETTQYKVFKNILNKNPIKFKISQFYSYKALENDIDIQNIYFQII